MTANDHFLGSLVRLDGLSNVTYNGRLGRVIDDSALETTGRLHVELQEPVCSPLLQEIEVESVNVVSETCDFELRGVTIALFRAIAKEALDRNTDKRYWNIGRVSAELNGNHEILKSDCRFGIVDKEDPYLYSRIITH